MQAETTGKRATTYFKERSTFMTVKTNAKAGSAVWGG
jgi:hypothetical protein